MRPAVLVRLRPLGPWRSGPGEGGRSQADPLFRSDRLFSALTLAFADLGQMDEWLQATALANEPAVRLGSLFPYQGDTLFAIPPSTLWPPPSNQVTSPSPVFLSKLRWAAAQFVPVTLVQTLLQGQSVLADQWVLDAESGCLLRRDRPSFSPFRLTSRRRVGVDRMTGASADAEQFACIEFEPTAGLWTAITFADKEAEALWRPRVEAAFRLLSDTGLGAGRRVGWGQFAVASFEQGTWPALLMPKLASVWRAGETERHWLLSLYSPGTQDSVDWAGGEYRLTTRSAWQSKSARFVEEGSVIVSAAVPVGRAVDLAHEGATHPVYRSGIALTISLPEVVVAEPAPEVAATEVAPEVEPDESRAEADAAAEDELAEALHETSGEDSREVDTLEQGAPVLAPTDEEGVTETVSSDGIEPVGFDEVVTEGLEEGVHSSEESAPKVSVDEQRPAAEEKDGEL